jgi:hypothetical protein
MQVRETEVFKAARQGPDFEPKSAFYDKKNSKKSQKKWEKMGKKWKFFLLL